MFGGFRIPDLVKNKYQTSHAGQLKDLEEKIGQSKTIAQALRGHQPETPAAVGATESQNSSGHAQDRTVASPDFEGAAVPDLQKRVELEAKPLEEFNNSRTLLVSFFSLYISFMILPTAAYIYIYICKYIEVWYLTSLQNSRRGLTTRRCKAPLQSHDGWRYLGHLQGYQRWKRVDSERQR